MNPGTAVAPGVLPQIYILGTYPPCEAFIMNAIAVRANMCTNVTQMSNKYFLGVQRRLTARGPTAGHTMYGFVGVVPVGC